MIHTTELNGDTNAQYSHINKDDDNTQIVDVDVENMQRERRGRERKRSEGTGSMFNGGIQYILPNFHTKKYSHPWIKLLSEMCIISELFLYKGDTGLTFSHIR